MIKSALFIGEYDNNEVKDCLVQVDTETQTIISPLPDFNDSIISEIVIIDNENYPVIPKDCLFLFTEDGTDTKVFYVY